MASHHTKETVTILLISAPEPARLSKQIREIAVRHGGQERVAICVDSFRLYAFAEPAAALSAACDVRTELAGAFRSQPTVALTTGKITCFDDVVFGAPITLGEVLVSCGSPGQLLASESFLHQIQGLDSDRYVHTDLGEHRFRELPKRLRIWQISLPDERVEFGAIRSLAERPNNLPNDATSFVGRGNDIEAIQDYLTFSRIVTLLGTAGAGKTRLAIQSGQELLRHFRDGVYLVRLVDAEEGVHIPSLIAQAMKVEPREIDNALNKKQVLVILDNCEHVVDDVYATCRRFLESHEEISFLLTSRQPILPGIEQEHYVEPLSLPATEGPRAPLRGEAVRLFLERLLLYRPTFTLTEASVRMIARICDRLEGLPLAIELAAARARLLSLEEVYDALEDELQLLCRTDDRATNLHGTMTGTIEWSFRLLEYHESRLLSRLSVFTGGFTASSAMAVADLGDVPNVGQALDQLVAKSLIFPIESPTYESRFRMLEPIRQYAGSLLEDQNEILERMLAWCLDLNAGTNERLTGPNTTSTLKMIDAELPNIRVALHYGLEAAPERALDLVLMMHGYWMRSSHHQEGRRWAQRALEFIEPEPIKKAQAFNIIGSSCFLSHAFETAQTYLMECLEIYESLQHWEKFAVVSTNLAMVEVQLSDRKAAEHHFQRAVDILRRGEDRARLLNGIANLANFYRDDEPEIALLYLHEAIDLARELGDRYQECHCLAMISTVQAETARFEEARESLLGFLRLHDYPDPKRCLMALEAATRLALEEQEPRQARRWLAICDRLRQETGITPGARKERIDALRGRIQGAGLALVSNRADAPPPKLQRTLSQVAKWLSKTSENAAKAR